MNETDATKALSILVVFDRRDWSAPTVEAWTHAIRKCTDVNAALTASEALVNNTDPRDWSLHRWRQAYQDALRTSAPALPLHREGPLMSLAQYMDLLANRAASGNAEAAEELALFRKYRDGQILRGIDAA